MSKSSRSRVAAGALVFIASIGAAAAHPHVWVSVRDEVVFDKGLVTGVEQHWSFDEMYATMAIEGLDTNHDGVYDREELKELAQTNVDGLKDFDYFTYAKAAGKDLVFAPPRDYWLEYKNNILTLHFFLPLAAPLKPDANGIRIVVRDPSFFIDFAFDKDHAVALAPGAPAQCSATLVADDNSGDQQALNQAFATQMVQIGSGVEGTALVRCKG